MSFSMTLCDQLVANTVLVVLAMHYHYARVGMREHITDIPPENTILVSKISTASPWIYMY